MGRDKALLLWQQTTLLGGTINSLRDHTELVIVVAGSNKEAIRTIVYEAGAYLITNPAPERGQFSSLQVGLQEVLNRGRDAAFIALVDRPAPRHDTIALLRARFLEVCSVGKWAVVPEYRGSHGHPIVAGRELIEAFLKAPVSSTAREVEHAVGAEKKIDYFPVEDPAVTMNMDTPEDYARLRQ